MKRLWQWLRRWWREALIASLICLPVLTLPVAGMLWLWEHDAVLVWLTILLAATFVAVALVRLSGSTNKEDGFLPSSPDLAPAEREARKRIEEIAGSATAENLASASAGLCLSRRVIEAVAKAYNPDSPHASARFSFTLPEALLLAERLSGSLRCALLGAAPSLRDVRLSVAVHVQEAVGPVRFSWRVFRAVRFTLNPIGALIAEARSLVIDIVAQPLVGVAMGRVAQILARQIGEAAILLYSGQLRKDAAELAVASKKEASRTLAPEPPEGPITILFAGQPKAGKSTLLNALSGRERAITSPLPMTKDFPTYALDEKTAGELRLVDSPGFGESPSEAFLEQATSADLIIWVVAAHRADRAPDQRALARFQAWHAARPGRRPTPIVLALSHVDRLSPAGEWAPPYDFRRGERPKEKAIRGAMLAARTALQLLEDRSVPVAMLSASEAWNLRDAGSLWEAIYAALPTAKQKRLERLMGARGWLDKVSDAVTSIGTFATQAVRWPWR
jgi:predicted GTPase